MAGHAPDPRGVLPRARPRCAARRGRLPADAAPEAEQVTGRPGDLLLAHYLLGHNIGGNTSGAVRRAAYYRIKRAGHDSHWREFVADPWRDYDAIRTGEEAGLL